MSAMKRTEDLTLAPSSQQKTCYFTLLPCEVKNLITKYLTFDDRESEEEFITRTKIPKNVPLDHYDHLLCSFPFGSREHKSVFCPNETHIAVLESLHCTATKKRNSLTIFNVKTKNIKDIRLIRSTASMQIALSRFGTMLAYINVMANLPLPFNDDMHYNYTIVTENINTTKEIKEFLIPKSFHHESLIAFNKQGDRIIVHGTDSRKLNGSETKEDLKNNSSMHHLIFPLKSKPQDGKDLEKTLEEYFRQRLVCKDIRSIK